MKARFVYIALVVFLSVAVPVFANASALTFSESSSGEITAVFSAGPCAAGLNPVAPASATLNANQFQISSSYAVFDPIPNCNPALSPPYTISVLLGNIPNGHYTAVWVYGPAQVTGEFDVVAGSPQLAVTAAPTLGRISLLALIAVVVAMAALLMRRASTP